MVADASFVTHLLSFCIYCSSVQLLEDCAMQVFIPGHQRVRKVGNSLVVTIPADIAAQSDVKEGDLVRLIMEPVEQITIPRLPPDLQQALDQVLAHDQDALRYLGGKPPAE